MSALAALVGGIALATVVHELAHFVAARCFAGREPVRIVRTGLTFAVVATLPSRSTTVFFLAAGPLGNLVAAALCAALGQPLLAFVQLACAAVNLIPHGSSDGAKLLHLFRRLHPGRTGIS